ncbi:MAG: tetratricopeptide repeat protein [Planctomycetota bacterium]
MRKLVTQAGLGIVGVVLCGLFACMTTEPVANPGALPTAKSTNVDPRLDASTYLAHGHLLERQGHFEKAVAQYREALKVNPNLVAAHNRLGITLNKLGRHAEASAEFRAALELEPRAAHLYNNLGFSLYLDGHFEAAERALARATELQPDFRRAHMNRGLVLARLEHYDEALSAFCEAGPRDEAYYNLAVVQTEAGNYVAAARALEQALTVNPDFAAARQQLREIARLAAAQEAEQAALAAAEAAAETTAATESAAAASQLGPPAPEPTPDAMPPVATNAPTGSAGATPRDAAANAQAWRQIHYLLAAAEQIVCTPRPRPLVDRAKLAAMFDEWIVALWQEAPWQEDSLARLLTALNRPAQRL